MLAGQLMTLTLLILAGWILCSADLPVAENSTQNAATFITEHSKNEIISSEGTASIEAGSHDGIGKTDSSTDRTEEGADLNNDPDADNSTL